MSLVLKEADSFFKAVHWQNLKFGQTTQIFNTAFRLCLAILHYSVNINQTKSNYST